MGDSEGLAVNGEQSHQGLASAPGRLPAEAGGTREEALIAVLGLGEARPALGLGFRVELFEVRGPQ